MSEDKIENKEFLLNHVKRRDGFIAQAKAVLGDVSIDRLWEMYGDSCVSNEDYLDGLISCQEALERIEMSMHLVRSGLEKVDNEHKLAALKLLSESRNLIAESFVKGAEISKEVVAKKGARARYARDPKQAALRNIREHWNQWRDTGFDKTQYAGKTAFAKDMIEAYPVLNDYLSLTRKMTAWERDET